MKSHLEAKIKEKAQAMTQEAIREFRRECFQAFNKLMLNTEDIPNDYQDALPKDSKAMQVFTILTSNNFKKGWPLYLWEIREKSITNDIVDKMDLVSRVLNCPKPEITEEPAKESPA